MAVFQVEADGDDGDEGTTGLVNVTDSTIQMFFANTHAGFHFTGVNIPSGATITSAKLTIWIHDTADDFLTGKNMVAENANNPDTWEAGLGGDITGRTDTDNPVSLGSGDVGSSGYYELPEMKTEIQQVVDDNSGTGDALNIIIHSTTTNDLEIESHVADTTNKSAYITITWTEGGGEPAPGKGLQVNVGDAWKQATMVQINIGDTWKTVTKMQINIGDSWKTVFDDT